MNDFALGITVGLVVGGLGGFVVGVVWVSYRIGMGILMLTEYAHKAKTLKR